MIIISFLFIIILELLVLLSLLWFIYIYIYMYYAVFGLVWFDGTSTIVGYECQIDFNIYKQFCFKLFSLV